ncbi:hypothetical protein [Gloeothece verrucosa]|uniref:CobQ/CobB/MinD/ParA nucleotide binding domain-containing protein n=1 Tax=Gloeothece verrucosa (strain PCC 7822) TaxID=497965 RepID=E0UNH3_GLOV7|nr:hypothetical protein [Gloeothece verrucosa]ADN18503.1 hypothetical protein Cyan7822_6856 [Gloeothece verrucosa PCC 7822]
MSQLIGQLHFITGEKGGVGKSMYCRALLEYLSKEAIDYIFYDADRTSPDVGLVYEPSKYDKIIANGGRGTYSAPSDEATVKEDYPTASQIVTVAPPPGGEESFTYSHIYFSEDEEDIFKADRLCDQALEGNIVIVNLPAQVEVILDRWFDQQRILESIESDESTKMYFWFVTDGSPESLELLSHSIKIFAQQINHIVVCNLGLHRRARESVAHHGVAKRINEMNIPVIDLPELIFSKPEMQLFKESRLKLSELADRTKRHPQFPLLDRVLVKQRAKTFLDKCFDAISITGVFAPILAEMELEKEKAASALKKGRAKKKASSDTVTQSTTTSDVHSANGTNGNGNSDSPRATAEPLKKSAEQLLNEMNINVSEF